MKDTYVGGSYISAITVNWALAEMIRNPVILEKAQAEVRGAFGPTGRVEAVELVELKYLKMVIKETLRIHPPVPLIPRECREKCEINGYVIPAKTTVIINAWAINRDHMYWKDGETFDPERFRDSSIDFKGSHFEFVPFGGGSRICPGLNFGIANVELLLAMLLYHFDWELPDGLKSENLDMTEKFNSFGERKNNLYLIPEVHQALPKC
ncbi:hypothetical protein MLD38_034273 [Melastoma candidum]|uniref:Uncharacterized protein n=1 Tax=Melastoma candidum TaxID=119954 RepID=A0ACB9M9X8_9MYRT|nr:hypothetical protein MLD38_034273 [Melastoma candidum]